MSVGTPVQSKEAIGWTAGGGITVSFTSTPTSGNTLVALLFSEGGGTPTVTSSGWSLLETATVTAPATLVCYTKLAGASEPTAVTTNFVAGGQNHWMAIYEIDGTLDAGVHDHKNSQPITATLTASTLSPTVNPGIILAAFYGQTKTYTGPAVWTPTAPLVTGWDDSNIGGRAEAWTGYMPTTTGSYTPTVAQAGLDTNQTMSIVVALVGVTVSPPVADFDADFLAILEGGTVAFTDLSTNTPTSWTWTFGDGGTSTSQNPSHVFAAAGTYTVSLTATNADGSDTETKTGYIHVTADVGYEQPAPAGPLLEIYASDPDSPRWDEANWDEAVWGEAGWQDVTPEGVTIQLTWGSSEPERGILHSPSADSWAIEFYDPDRLLDPANADSPYFRDLIPFLPVRVSHRQKVIALGFAESIGHSYIRDPLGINGYMRVTNNLSRLANAKVPSTSILGNTLYDRAADAINAAGLNLQVQSPLGTDPPLVPWGDLDPVPDWSAWDWITDAAEQCHYIPIVNRATGILEFRPWAAPLSRGRSIDSPNLVDLQVISEYRGLYSVVQALDDGTPPGTIIERALTPPPRYGARTFTRSDPTLDAGDWAAIVLADRALPGLRWIPGTVYPLSADDVEYFAGIQAVELVSMSVVEDDPPVAAAAIIVGGQLTIVGKKEDEAIWRFTFQAAQTATEPLIETGGESTDYLLATGGGEFLYPST